MPTPNPNGNPNSFFVARVRRELRDPPKTFTDPFTGDGLRGGFGAGSQPYTLQRPVVVNPANEAVNGVVCTVNAANVPVVYDSLMPAAGTVSVITETGELVFGTLPPAGQSVLVTYQAANNGTQQILDALTEGMNSLYPDIYQTAVDQTSVILTPTTTEYVLPAVFNDPKVTLIEVEVAPPSGIITFFSTGLWELSGANNDVVKFERAWPPGSIARLTYNSPYAVLSDVEPQVMWLPVYYAVAKLLEAQEVRRSRQADLVALAGEGGSKPGDGAKEAERWMARFEQGKSQFGMPDPQSDIAKDRSVERLPFARAVGFSWDPF
jgi:hypothetical protein